MNARGFKGGSVRAPLRDLDGDAKQHVTQVMAAIASSPAAGLNAHAA
jgi:hypothetical protein